MQRRTFLKSTGAALLAGGAMRAADAEVQIASSNPGAVINPHIYGHFIEHLGGVIYDGIWVGKNSKIANIEGMRRRFVDDMKRIGAPNLRWPGGCFADGYHWRDGIGPAAKRPKTYNFWQSRMPAGTQATESNQFGLHEFMRLCRLINAAPYVAGNVGSGTPKEFHDWVSYCNAPAGTLTLAEERAANGDRDPFGIQYWGVGNESWGCGGTMRPGEYATLYRQFVTQFPVYTQPFLIATGPRGHSADMDISWTSGFYEGMRGYRMPDGFSIHYYTDLRPTTVKPGVFNAAEWYEVLLRGIRIDKVITDHWAEMGKVDRAHATKLVIDEWGVWYAPGSEITPTYILSQPITLRDAVHTALTFDIFNRHADKLVMANVAQTVNCIHSLFLAQGDQYCRTPAYHVWDMYRPHMGAKLLPAQVQVPELSVTGIAGSARMAGLSASASIREKRMAVTLTNPSLTEAVATRIALAGGARATEVKATILTHADMRAQNTFAKPEEVKPATHQASVEGAAIRVNVPKQAVVALDVVLA
jgi:alpha-N-arabinofuranosidase